MKIKTKFNLKDHVWHIHNSTKEVVSACPFCNGIGTIGGADNSTRTCPQCYGRSTKSEWLPTEWRVNGLYTVGQIKTRFSVEQEYEEEYMFIETGIGGGSLYYDRDIFETRKEAEKECAKRNSKSLAQRKVG